MKELMIPEGRVSKLYSGSVLLWQREGGVKLFDYLQFNGTSYFDTGIVTNQDTAVELWANDIVWNNRTMFGSRYASRNRSLTVHLNANQLLLDFAGSRLPVLKEALNPERQHIIGGAGTAEYTGVDNTQIGWQYNKGIWVCTCSFVIGAMNSNGAVSGQSTYKLERLILREGDTVLADYAPSQNNLGVFCLFNRADGSFLLPADGTVVCGNY